VGIYFGNRIRGFVMATYDDLTQEQKDAVQTLQSLVRATAGEIAKLGNHCRAIASNYAGNVETMLGTITSGSEVIPKSDGLAGSQSLTKTELVNLIGYCLTLSDPTDNAVGSYNTNYHRALYSKAAGPVNTIG